MFEVPMKCWISIWMSFSAWKNQVLLSKGSHILGHAHQLMFPTGKTETLKQPGKLLSMYVYMKSRKENIAVYIVRVAIIVDIWGIF